MCCSFHPMCKCLWHGVSWPFLILCEFVTCFLMKLAFVLTSICWDQKLWVFSCFFLIVYFCFSVVGQCAFNAEVRASTYVACIVLCLTFFKGESIVSHEITFVFSKMVHKWPNFNYWVLSKELYECFWHKMLSSWTSINNKVAFDVVWREFSLHHICD